MLRQLLLLAIMLLFSSCLHEQSVPIASSFSIEVAEDKTSPVIVQLKSESYGADEYEWTFEGESQVINEGSTVSMRFI